MAAERHDHASHFITGVLIDDLHIIPITPHRVIVVAVAKVARRFFSWLIWEYFAGRITGDLEFLPIHTFAVFTEDLDVDGVVVAGLVDVLELDNDRSPKLLTMRNLGWDEADVF